MLNTKKIKQRAQKSFGRAQFVMDSQVLNDSNDYIPADDWNLRDSSLTHSNLGEGDIKWRTPYGRKLYYNPQFNFSTDKNPQAQGLWFEAAKSKDKDSWITQSKKEFEANFN
ncbi:minor capsid protein [Salipaludibacillus aurantiacus]|uniref:minor capsid protein n=1 Tax=Salipaludibacillus aurantiacus TaxID=1601833 RepID=UPI001FDEB64D|nr:minor capsid protein [Salipaludibacillus aurantiacus]